MKVSPLKHLILAVLFLCVMPKGRAVIISSGDGTGNTAAPVGDQGWSYVGTINGASGVYLGGSGGMGWVLTANHVGFGDFVTSDGTRYNAVNSSGVQIGSIDLYAFQVVVGSGTGLSMLGNLTLSGTAPSDGQMLTMIGYGLDRSPSRTTWYVDTTPASWIWSTNSFTGWDNNFYGYTELSSNTKRWGTNLSAGVTNISGTSMVETLYTTAPARGTQGAIGDSGGGVFSAFGGGYQLSGIMVEVGTFNNQPANTAVAYNALQGDLTYSIDISTYSAQINAVTGIPEPSTWALTAAGACAVLLVMCRTKRRPSSSRVFRPPAS